MENNINLIMNLTGKFSISLTEEQAIVLNILSGYDVKIVMDTLGVADPNKLLKGKEKDITALFEMVKKEMGPKLESLARAKDYLGIQHPGTTYFIDK